MKNSSLFLKLIFIGLILSNFFNANCQKLIESRTTSYYTYIYKITDKEARKVYKKDLWKVDTSFFHMLVDSFQTDSLYSRKLPKGHYIKAFTDNNKLKVSITTVQDFDVFILNNNTDLCVQVYDLEGNIIKNADVSVRWKKLHFNKKTQSYLDKKSNQKGLLQVTYNGSTVFYDLSRQYNNSFIKRGTRKLVYGTPIKYAWLPVNYVVYLPIDGVKSIINYGPQGTIYRTKYFFVRSFEKVACLFEDYHCNSNKFKNKHTGYIVFSKPKYLPGDTVKFKAFITTKKGNLADEEVSVVLTDYRKDKLLAKLSPYRDGGYKYEFFLHDSLQLQLDRNYTIRLQLNGRKEYIRGSFRYEDYELSKNKLELRTDTKEHFRNKDLKFYAKGTDENDLNLLDARVEVLVKPKSINKYFENYTFIPDTLFYLEKKLIPTDETEIAIPDSTFPKVNFDCKIYVRMRTSDNEVVEESKEITYYYESNKFNIELKTDSIYFNYLRNGEPEKKSVVIKAQDNFGNKKEILKTSTPCSVELNPYYSSYIIQSENISDSIDISSEASLLQCYSERTKDSVYIMMDNPRQIPFSYTIYKRNAQQSAGYTDSLNIKQKLNTKQNYFVSLRYLWGGEIKEENYRIPLVDKKLNITVNQPKIVYPGQKSHVEVFVTDYKGNPVEGVDLTAYSLTQKFDYSAPVVPYLGKQRRNKSVINNFHFGDFNLEGQSGLYLNYESWKILAGIDSIEYYKFIYPKNSIYKFEYYTKDSLIQFSPFVTWMGNITPIHVIYVDSKPVYFSWSTNTQPYSFGIDEGYHQIKLRTNYREIVIDSLYFEPNKKLIFSLDQDLEARNVRINKTESALSDHEKRLLYKYILPYRNNFGEHYTYLKQGDNIQFLNPVNKYRSYNNFAGPIVGNVTYHMLDSFSTNFNHEPFFEYEFVPELLKMRDIDRKKYPTYLDYTKPISKLNDEVLTEGALHQKWEEYVDSKRYMTASYINPNFTNEGAGRLLIDFKKNDRIQEELPLNILLFRYDNPDFLRVYPGNTTLIHDLQEGNHKLIFFYSRARYHVEDLVFVRPNGVNYYKFEKPQIMKKDTFSVSVSKLIEETLYKQNYYYQSEGKDLKQIYNAYQQQFKYTGAGDIVEGYVYDNETGDPLPGASVVVKGTTYGAVTNLDGYYSMKVPSGNNTLTFSFVGYMQEERQIGNDNIVNMELVADIMALDEVVVIGYGVQRKAYLTGSVATVSSGSLLGVTPGVHGNASQALQGKLSGISISSNKNGMGEGVQISIRGASTPILLNKIPLYIINGNVYTGDISELDPELIQNFQILHDESATAIYGAKGANGVVIIETKPGAFKSTKAKGNKGAEYDAAFFEVASLSSSIRDNFSDYAFWQPSLVTDKDGKASFDVTFPDDVTSWKTFYLAMNENRQSGQTEGTIKSYKPLMAQLAIPRFMIKNDTANAIGKVLNYSPDSVHVETFFEINGDKKLVKKRYCTNSLIDTLPFIANEDTVFIKYFLEGNDGYYDGEVREIPVFPKGLKETKGNFYVLDKDTTIRLIFDSTLGSVTLYARTDILEVIEDEISSLINYKYSCNEQLASKLKALIAKRNIKYYKGEKFKDDNEVEKLIRLLNKNQKESGLWGWWKDSRENLWISLHVLEALVHAQNLGYNTKLDKGKITDELIWELQNSKEFYSQARILKILVLLGSQINYQPYISELENSNEITLNKLLHILELKELCNIDYSLDTLQHYQQSTLFGNIYYADEQETSNLLVNDIQNTLLAYKLLKADSTNLKIELNEVRNYFLETRKNRYWRNTYESIKIIETILPDLLQDKSEIVSSTLTIDGDINKTISEFPFEMKIEPDKNVEISKTGDFPIYFTSYQRYWNSSPTTKKGDFEITTSFGTKAESSLNAGEETKLIAKVIVKKDAEYVMLNIPIPGGCSYADKKNSFRHESHREYFKNETTIFCEYLPKGEYTFEIELIPRYSGTYTVNPAKIELMYFPVFNANNGINRIEIK